MYKSNTFVFIEKTLQDSKEVSSAGHKETEQETKCKLLPGVWGALHQHVVTAVYGDHHD